LEGLGFLVNHEKSYGEPSQVVEHLGLIVDSKKLMFALPEDKITKIISLVGTALSRDTTHLRLISSILGNLVWAIPAFPLTQAHYRLIQRFLLKETDSGNGLEKRIKLPEEVKSELSWWAQNIRSNNGRSFFSADPEIVIYPDASNSGWGAVYNDIGTGGPWTPSEDLLHINCKELLAAFHALRSFVKSTNVSVELRLDNQSAVTYINKGGGTQSSTLSSIAVECLLWCESRKVSVRAIHLPGAVNRAADAESRRSQGCAEWRLCPTTFQQVAHLWHVDVDLFSAEWNHQLPRFVSWGPQPSAWAVDALSISWFNVKGYLFPPFKLIGRCAAKVRRDRTIATLITPYWPGQYWFPVLLEMSADAPRILRPHPHLLTSSNGLLHPMFQSGSHLLVAWRISGSDTQAREFRQTLSNSCLKVSDPIHSLDTSQRGALGVIGVCRGVRIPAYVM
jgi:hypothetical protein